MVLHLAIRRALSVCKPPPTLCQCGTTSYSDNRYSNSFDSDSHYSDLRYIIATTGGILI